MTTHSLSRPALAAATGRRPSTIHAPVYDLDDTLNVLGLKSRQLFHQSGLAHSIRFYQVGKVRLYNAADVQEWARRLARLRLAQRAAELRQRYPLTQAPATAERDAVCPKCQAFARRSANGDLWCLQGHRTPPSA